MSSRPLATTSMTMNGPAPSFRQSATVHYRRRSSKELARLWLAFILILLDVLVIQIAFLAIDMLFVGTPVQVGLSIAMGTVIPIFLICAFMLRAYSGPAILNAGLSVGRALQALATSAAVLGLILFSLDVGPGISRTGMALTIGISALLIACIHYFYAKYVRGQLGDSFQSIVELCDGSVPRPGGCESGLDTRFFFDPLYPSPASFDRLANVISGADRVIVHCGKARRAAWADVLQGMNVHAEFIAGEWADIRPLGIGEHKGERTVVVARGPLNLHDRVIKRCFDIAFSATALIALAPLLVVVAIIIRLDSKGPIFFVQPRIGRNNKLFNLIKFRSMRQDLCDRDGALSTCRQDSRVTRVGHFIRRTSIDELPQLINILKGDMSVVGPRPHAVSSTADDRLFWDIDNRYWHRHACRPGLTGLAQIQGLRGATACARDLTDRVAADLEYLQRWSFWSDIKIICRTFKVICHANSF